jgi:hypothetical protein
MDLVMPNEDGTVFLKTLAALSPRPKLLIASGCEQPVIDMARRHANSITGTLGLLKPIVKKPSPAQLLSFSAR